MTRIDRDLRRRTAAEDLLMWRWHAGLTQVAAAERLQVSRTALSAAENDPETAIRAPARVTYPSDQTLLILARRRYGRGLRGTAAAVGVSHRTLLAWERRADLRLFRFWSRRGFRFRGGD